MTVLDIIVGAIGLATALTLIVYAITKPTENHHDQ